MPSAQYSDENERLVIIASFDLDFLEGDGELARIARFAAQLCNAPMAMVSIIDAERQRFIAQSGTKLPGTARANSFCAQTMGRAQILEVRDASIEEPFNTLTFVTGEPHIRFYAGVPLVSTEGAPLGALCIKDTNPRPEGLTEIEREGLMVLGEAVKRRLQAHRQATNALAQSEAYAERLRFVIDNVPDIAWSARAGGRFDYFSARWNEVTGLEAPRVFGDWRAALHPDTYKAARAEFADAVRKAIAFEGEWRVRQADGSYRWMLSRAIPSGDDPITARWFGTLTDIDENVRISKERELLAGELAHRIKNIFSVIIGLIALHARGKAQHAEFADLLSANIRALARAQEFALQMNPTNAADLRALLEVLLAPYGAPGEEAVVISGEKIGFGKRAATPLALIFHELATNSAKYGALGQAGGRVSLAIIQKGDDAIIDWHETGGPPVTAPKKEGFGSRLIDMAIRHQLGGELEHQWLEAGLHARITLPLSRLEG